MKSCLIVPLAASDPNNAGHVAGDAGGEDDGGGGISDGRGLRGEDQPGGSLGQENNRVEDPSLPGQRGGGRRLALFQHHLLHSLHVLRSWLPNQGN